MDKTLYTLIVHSENIAGLLNQVTAVFTRRQINIESLNVSACAAILIQGMVERLHRSDVEWQLDEHSKAQLLYRWMRESVKEAEPILRQKFGDDI